MLHTQGSNLRRHSVTEVQDGHVVVVGSLVQTQVILQRVFHLREMEKIRKKYATFQITSNRDAEVCLGAFTAGACYCQGKV